MRMRPPHGRSNGPALSRANRTRYSSTHGTGAALRVGWSVELAASRAVCVRALSLTKFPQHEEQGSTHDRASHIWYEVSKAAMALAGEPLCQLNIDSHCQHCARRNQNLSTRAPAAHLRA